ncbi:MAG: HEAT repeat domain-containing protein [Planctomycetaceae bacterium]|jgi:HEAT repeat protein|nr:HEAT repeat domain-containing protein [Planctomycetaceae bacterium]MDC0273940.1 HEAT repeat domain-containing protein [Planctomycetaceae bacterium]MDG2389980.1 HEAT repeat domain-containing protein [Planctomycetaceae bacterium]
MAEWALIEADIENEDGEIREAGMRKLLEISDRDSSPSPEIIEILQTLVISSERSQPEQEQAAMCLGHFQCESALRDFATADNSGVRSHAAAGFGYCGTETSVASLSEMLTDSVNTVRNMTERALIRQMNQVKQSGIDRLLELLDHPAPLTHSPAARILGLTQDERALQPLLDKSNHGEKWLTRMWATKALGDLGRLEAFETLKTRLESDEKNRVRAVAAIALGELRHPDSRQTLEAAESDEDSGVKTAIEEALDALSQLGDVETSDPFADENA